jgi:predicted GIY-YIG superfamily endonuclease
MYYTYILKINGKFYIGYTEDLRRRLKEHNLKGETSLIYYEAYSLKESATNREKKLKHYGSAWRALRKRIVD